MKNKSIVVRDLRKYFRKVRAVDGISFDVFEGELFALLGQNGAGKSTTMRVLTNLALPTSGRIEVAGFDVLRNAKRVREKIGLVSDKVILYDQLTAMENIAFFAGLYNIGRPEIEKRAEKFLKLFEIWDSKDTLVSKMSTGMKQKINLARALVPDPEILFLDEPTLGLDPVSTKHIRDFIVSLRGEGKTVVYTTHVLHDIELMNADRVAIMRKGKIVAMGSLSEIKRHFRKTETVEFETSPSVPTERIAGKILEKDEGYVKAEISDLNEFLKSLSEAGVQIRSIKTLEPSLEDIYVEISEESEDAVTEETPKKDGR